jgi:glycosyltransferase involved in cell wall biosynthesis
MAEQEKAPANNIKILSVVWYKVLPPKFGGQRAVAFFNEHLGLHVPLVCLCSKNNELIKTSYKIQNLLPVSKMQFLNPLTWRKIYSTAKNEKATHLILEFPYHGIAGFICKKWLGINLIIHTHNIEFLRFKEQKKWWWGPLFHFEKWVLKNANTVLFKTEKDKLLAQKHFSLEESNLAVVPYGVEKSKMTTKGDAQGVIRKRHKIKEDEKIILFAGTLDYRPNADAVVSLVKKIIPQLDEKHFQYRIIVCGRNRLKQFEFLNSIKNDKMIFAGEVEDMENYFMAADVFINPVISGGGVQTKILDALSYHLNVVCFESKLSGIKDAGNKIFSVQNRDWKAFVQGIIEAANKTEVTPIAFFEAHNWHTIAVKALHKIGTI